MISTASIFQSPSTQDPATTFAITASFPGVNRILNVTATASTILPGQVVTGKEIPYNAKILAYGTAGTTGVGGIGSYALSVYGPNVGSEQMTVTLSPVGLAGVGSLWYQTDTKLIFNRNTVNNGWNFLGPIDSQNLGLLPKAGGIINQKITGSTGLMTNDGLTPFNGVPYVNSKNSLAATLADLAESQSGLEQQISASVSSNISDISLPSLNSNIVIRSGFGCVLGVYTGINVSSIVTLYVPISGLTYADGTVVQASECKVFASANISTSNTFGNGLMVLNQLDSNGLTWQCYEYFSSGNNYINYTINYILIAIKSGA